MEIIALWLIFSILVWIYASKRGRDGFLAFVLAIFLSPVVAFVLYAVLGESKKARGKRIYEEERLRAEARSNFARVN